MQYAQPICKGGRSLYYFKRLGLSIVNWIPSQFASCHRQGADLIFLDKSSHSGAKCCKVRAHVDGRKVEIEFISVVRVHFMENVLPITCFEPPRIRPEVIVRGHPFISSLVKLYLNIEHVNFTYTQTG